MWRARDGELSAFVGRVHDFMYVRTRISASHSELRNFLLMTKRNIEATHVLQKTTHTARQRMTRTMRLHSYAKEGKQRHV